MTHDDDETSLTNEHDQYPLTNNSSTIENSFDIDENREENQTLYNNHLLLLRKLVAN